MKKVATLILCAFIAGCKDDPGKAYPPSRYLSDTDQKTLLNKFLLAQYDTIDGAERESMGELHEIYKLEYYVSKSSRAFFMISENRNMFKGPFVAYMGEFGYGVHDTTIVVNHVLATPFNATPDSIKVLFDFMIRWINFILP